ncbi:hypothetical protein HK102_012844 [Quaeritorhiza haematococci]|nr:hypothetical protein HK102_012844 [Quaeritorhiza haematococci]
MACSLSLTFPSDCLSASTDATRCVFAAARPGATLSTGLGCRSVEEFNTICPQPLDVATRFPCSEIILTPHPTVCARCNVDCQKDLPAAARGCEIVATTVAPSPTTSPRINAPNSPASTPTLTAQDASAAGGGGVPLVAIVIPSAVGALLVLIVIVCLLSRRRWLKNDGVPSRIPTRRMMSTRRRSSNALAAMADESGQMPPSTVLSKPVGASTTTRPIQSPLPLGATMASALPRDPSVWQQHQQSNQTNQDLRISPPPPSAVFAANPAAALNDSSPDAPEGGADVSRHGSNSSILHNIKSVNSATNIPPVPSSPDAVSDVASIPPNPIAAELRHQNPYRASLEGSTTSADYPPPSSSTVSGSNHPSLDRNAALLAGTMFRKALLDPVYPGGNGDDHHKDVDAAVTTPEPSDVGAATSVAGSLVLMSSGSDLEGGSAIISSADGSEDGGDDEADKML